MRSPIVTETDRCSNREVTDQRMQYLGHGIKCTNKMMQRQRSAAYDRPANWISNLLCFGYDICRAPLTGGDGRGQTKLLRVSSAQPAPGAELEIYPNPAASWVTFRYDLQSEPEQAELVVRDAAGRTVYSVALQASEQQQLWDT